MQVICDNCDEIYFNDATVEHPVRFYEFKMADPIWLPCYYKISIKLVVFSMEYISFRAQSIWQQKRRME